MAKAHNLSEIEKNYILGVNWSDRWQVYQRLQLLDIPCWCDTNQPLKVKIENPLAAIQVWCVIRQLTASRQDLVLTLQRSWQSGYL